MLELSFLKRPFVTLHKQPITGFVSDKVIGLLAYLALNGGEQSRERLATLLWGEMPDNRAKANLRQALHNIQKQLPGYLNVTRKTAAFTTTQPVTIDVHQIEAAFQSGAVAAMEQAAGLYQDDLLSGLVVQDSEPFDHWLRERREELRLKLLHIVTQLVDEYEQRQTWDAAIAQIRRVLTIEPWHEEMHQKLMLLLARRGQYSAAIAQYQTCRQILQSELGVEPMPETTAVFHRINALRKRPLHNLPPQPTPFFGREKLLDDLAAQLVAPQCRLLSLLGPGGIGKTRAAIQLAERVQPAFLEGVVFVPLVGLLPSDNLLTAVAAELLNIGLIAPAVDGKPTEQLLQEQLRDKELLLVLDNVEHLLDQIGSLLALLEMCAGLKLLITSRERVNSVWERPFFLEGFHRSGRQPADSEAVQFFAKTAQRTLPSFAITVDNAAAVATICQQVEGMPLGIELAAAWLYSYTPHQIVEQISGQLTMLKHERRDKRRHQDLTAVLDQSWLLLNKAERALLAALSVFRGGVSLRAAEAVAAANRQLLLSLVDKSLLRLLPNTSNETRFELHELIRQYAEMHLEDGEAVREKHGRYFVNWLARIEPDLKNQDQIATLKLVEQEQNNIQAGWQWAIGARQTAVFLPAARPLAFFFRERNLPHEGFAFFDAAPAHDPPTPTQACFLLHKTRFQFALRQYEAAVRLLQRIRPVLESSDRYWEAALAIRGASLLAENQTDVIRGLEQSIALFRKVGDQYEVATDLLNLASWSFPQKTAVYIEEAIQIYEQLDEQLEMARAITFRAGLLVRHLGQFQRAKEEYHRSVALQSFEDTYWTFLNLMGLGNADMALGNYDESMTHYQQADHLLERINESKNAYKNYGILYRVLLVRLRKGQWTERDLVHLDDHQIEANTANELIDVGYFHLYKALGYLALAQYDAAAQHGEAAVSQFGEGQIWMELIEAHCLLGRIQLRANQQKAARAAFAAALQMGMERQSRPLFYEAAAGLGQTIWVDKRETAVQLLTFTAKSDNAHHHFRQLARDTLAQHGLLVDEVDNDGWETAVQYVEDIL